MSPAPTPDPASSSRPSRPRFPLRRRPHGTTPRQHPIPSDRPLQVPLRGACYISTHGTARGVESLLPRATSVTLAPSLSTSSTALYRCSTSPSSTSTVPTSLVAGNNAHSEGVWVCLDADAQVSCRYRRDCRPGTGAASEKCQPGTGATVSTMNRSRTMPPSMLCDQVVTTAVISLYLMHEGQPTDLGLWCCRGARGGGLEPPMTGPEPVVLPITPPPKVEQSGYLRVSG